MSTMRYRVEVYGNYHLAANTRCAIVRLSIAHNAPTFAFSGSHSSQRDRHPLSRRRSTSCVRDRQMQQAVCSIIETCRMVMLS
jgi:hypothetical protein